MALIFLRDVVRVERVDLKPYCLELATKDKTYYISFKSDSEVYAWMDEIYQVCFYDCLIVGYSWIFTCLTA